MTPEAFFAKAYPLALASGHIWPAYACCEAAEESDWGNSELASAACNLFGQKQGHTTANAPTIVLPTREFIGGRCIVVSARFVKFPDWSASFCARMALLRALAAEASSDGAQAFPGYAAALQASTGMDYVIEVSKNWSTDARRAQNVLEIYNAHRAQLDQLAADAEDGGAQ